MKNSSPKTLAVHAGERLRESSAQPLSEPVYLSTVSSFDDAEELNASLDGNDYVYTRIRAQNAELLEEAVAALEGAEACAAFPTGMAALRAVLEAQPLSKGDRIVIPADGYGTSRALVQAVAAGRGVEVHPVKLSLADAPERIRALRPKLVLAESITNPLIGVPDVPALAAACSSVEAALAVDGTFASPVLQRPLALGADYSIQSTTKWIDGHSDAMGGTVSGPTHRILPLKSARIVHGAVLGPFEAWLTLRGLRTLAVRMRAHCENAMEVARRLAASPLVERTLYPGLPEHPDHAVAARVLQGGFGGMLAFEIRGGGRQEAFRFLDRVQLAKAAPSLGDVGTLVMHPVTASARRMAPEERAAAGIRESLIRVSVGLEEAEEIAADLLQAVSAAVEVRR